MRGKYLVGVVVVGVWISSVVGMDRSRSVERKKLCITRYFSEPYSVVGFRPCFWHNGLCSIESRDHLRLARGFMRSKGEAKRWRTMANDSLHCNLLQCGFGEGKGGEQLYRHAQSLIELGADPNQVIPFGGRLIPLAYKISYQLSLPAFRFLCEHGAIFSRKDILSFIETAVRAEIVRSTEHPYDVSDASRSVIPDRAKKLELLEKIKSYILNTLK